jgi:hypothetical protein
MGVGCFPVYSTWWGALLVTAQTIITGKTQQNVTARSLTGSLPWGNILDRFFHAYVSFTHVQEYPDIKLI